jgi:hypothetical protein
MANLIQEPADLNPATVDWQQLLNKLTATTGQLLAFALNLSNNVLTVKNGSRIEVNGSFYRVNNGNEAIANFSSLSSGFAFVYAIPNITNGLTCSFEYRTNIPVYDPMLGGWFQPGANARAIAVFYKGTNNTIANWAPMPNDGFEIPYEKVVLDENNFNRNQLVQSYGNVENYYLLTLQRGWFIFDIKSGRGNPGTKGGDSSISGTSRTAGLGANGGQNGISYLLQFSDGDFVLVSGGGGGGGGGGAGDDIISGNTAVPGGNGGNGGAGNTLLYKKFVSKTMTVQIRTFRDGQGGKGGNGIVDASSRARGGGGGAGGQVGGFQYPATREFTIINGISVYPEDGKNAIGNVMSMGGSAMPSKKGIINIESMSSAGANSLNNSTSSSYPGAAGGNGAQGCNNKNNTLGGNATTTASLLIFKATP